MDFSQVTQTFYMTLARTQQMSRGDILKYQYTLLEKLVRHARRHVPFYRDSGRLAPLFRADDRFDMAGWADVPILSRVEANTYASALEAETVPREMLPLAADCTSGSTGTPLRFRRTALARVAAEALLGRAITWHTPAVIGRGVGPVVVSRFVEEEPVPLTGHGPHTLPVHWSPADQVALIDRVRPKLIVTYPNLVLSWIAEAGRRVLDGVEILVLTGEVLHAEARARIGRAFKGKIIESYSTSEVGPLAFEAPGGTLRICEESVFVEGPEPERRAIPPAPIVVTPFYAYATPLIRYAPGDYATLTSAPSKAMSGLRGIASVLGRERNLFRRRDGATFWPSMSAKSLSAIANYRAWQLIQEDFDRFTLRIVLADDTTPEQVRRLVKDVTRAVGGGEVAVQAVAEIVDNRATGKTYESYICRVPAPAAA